MNKNIRNLQSTWDLTTHKNHIKYLYNQYIKAKNSCKIRLSEIHLEGSKIQYKKYKEKGGKLSYERIIKGV